MATCPPERLTPPVVVLAAGLALLGSGIGFAGTDDAEGTRTSQSCVMHRLIRSTRVIDDRRILFEFAGGRYLVNTLSAPCTGLRLEGRFAVNLRSALLCRGDMIEVIPRFGWGSSCSLGDFERVEIAPPAPAWRAEPVPALPPGPGSEHD